VASRVCVIGGRFVTCEDYQDWVAADVDGRAGDRSAEIAAHLEDCPACRALRAEQNQVRELLRARAVLEPAPVWLATRIRGHLDEQAERRSRGKLGALRAAVLGFAAASLALALLPRGPAAELAEIAESVRATEARPVGLAAREPAELAKLYARELRREQPPPVLDLAPALRLVGGTVRTLHGEPARVTTYRSAKGSVLCHLVPASAWPAIAARLDGEPFWITVGGVPLRVARAGDEICVLASRMALSDFRAVLGAA
jgi:anti-sigma factor RsiW